MMKSFVFAAALAAGTVAAPVSAAVFTFDFTSSGPYATQNGSVTVGGINYGNGYFFNATGDDGSTLRVRVSAYSQNGSAISLARLAQWNGHGLGAINQGEGNGSNNSHTVDDLNGTDFLVFQFDGAVVANSASAGAYAQLDTTQRRWETDNDFSAQAGRSTSAWNLGITNMDAVSLFGSHQVQNDGTTAVRGINPNGNLGNLLVIRAGGTDNLIDSLKLRTLTVSTIAVPEPASWAMMIAGFGLVGAGMRRRRAGPAKITA